MPSMSISAVSAGALVVCCSALATRGVSAVLLAVALRKRHSQLWIELGRPYLPFEMRIQALNRPFFDWCNDAGYREVDDKTISRLGSMWSVSLWVACIALVVCLLFVWQRI